MYPYTHAHTYIHYLFSNIFPNLAQAGSPASVIFLQHLSPYNCFLM